MIHHSKGLEKCYSKMIFANTLPETLAAKNPKNPEINPITWYVNEKVFNKYDILYIVEKVLKRSIQ